MSKHQQESARIPTADCIKGRVYSLGSRNLHSGVFNGDEGFIGIRTKFGNRYLDTEQHWDQGPPYGTVFRIEDTIDRVVPDDIEILMYLPSEFTEDLNPNDKLFEFLDGIENAG